MSDDEKPKIFQLGTVPPPAGEHDAYSAPTKVGPMAAQIAELINAAAMEAERKGLTAPPPPRMPSVPPSFPPSSRPSSVPEGRLPSIAPDDADDEAYNDETRIADGAMAAMTAPLIDEPLPTPPPPAPTPPPPALEIAELPLTPTPTRSSVEPGLPSVTDSDPEVSNYSDPIAHTRPEWSSVSKSEPKLPVAAPAPNRVPLLIGILVVVFGLLGIVLFLFGHRH